MRRILPHLIMPVIIAASIAAGVIPSASTKPAATPANWNSYRLILSRNIFMRDRSAQRSARSSRTRSGSSELVLAGVAEQGSEQLAFFEDSSSGDITRLAVGQNIGGGTVTAIRLEGVEITAGETVRTIAVGETLSGRPAELKSTSQSSSAAATAPAGLMTDDSDENQPADAASRPSEETSAGTATPMSIEERMRQRRLQESN